MATGSVLTGLAAELSFLLKNLPTLGALSRAMTQSDYARRYDAAVAEMRNAGLRGWSRTPMHVRIGRKMGFKPRPICYEPFAKAAVLPGVFFAVTWGLSMHVFVWREAGRPIAVQGFSVALAGLFFGIVMAAWNGRIHRMKNLSSWDDL